MNGFEGELPDVHSDPPLDLIYGPVLRRPDSVRLSVERKLLTPDDGNGVRLELWTLAYESVRIYLSILFARVFSLKKS